MKLVALCGAGGTGKSTVASLSGHNIPSPVDNLRKTFYGSAAKFGTFTKCSDIIDFQVNILYGQVAVEEYARLKEKDAQMVLAERSAVDYAAYTLSQTERFAKSKTSFALIQDYVTFCIDYANSHYDSIVYFPCGKFVPGDTAGSSKERDPASIERTNRYILSLLDRVSLPVLKLEPSDPAERLEAIRAFCGVK